MASTRMWKPPRGTHDVTIGPTMQAALDGLDGPASAPCLTEYYAVNFDCRPQSLDVRTPGKILTSNRPQSDGLPSFSMQYGSAENRDLHTFSGTQSQAKEFECLLIFDETTGEFILERLDSVITLEYDRASSSQTAGRTLDNSPGSAGTVSSGSPPTPPNVTYNSEFDNVQVADISIDDLETEGATPVVSKPTPPPSRPTHAAKSVMVVAPPERPPPAKAKGKRNRDALSEKDPLPRQAPSKRLPAAPAAHATAPAPPPPSAPLALPRQPPTPPSGLRSPVPYLPKSAINLSDDEDDVPLADNPQQLSKGATLEVDENPILAPTQRAPFTEGFFEEEVPNIDGMFDFDEEDGEGEGDDDEQDEDDESVDVDQAPGGPDLIMNELGGDEEEDEDDDDDDDDDDDSDEDSD